LLGGFADGEFGAGGGGDDEGEVVLGVAGELQDGFEADVFGREDAGELGDDAGAVVDAEAQVVRAVLEGDGDRFVFAEAFVGER
jgi:hypothetical protein